MQCSSYCPGLGNAPVPGLSIRGLQQSRAEHPRKRRAGGAREQQRDLACSGAQRGLSRTGTGHRPCQVKGEQMKSPGIHLADVSSQWALGDPDVLLQNLF